MIRRHFTSLSCAAILGAAISPPLAITAASANDSTAELGAGGIQLVRTEDVALLSEDLFVSADLVHVTYRFRNTSDEPRTYLVAFPLPTIDAIVPEEMNIVIPKPGDPNFVDFKVSVDGKPIVPSIEERATALGVDRTAELARFGLPLNPIAEDLYQTLDALPESTKAELNRLGLVYVDPYSVQAAWKLETTFYWEQTFPAARDVVVEHSYIPVVGYGFFGDWALSDDYYTSHFCIDEGFANAARRKLAAIKDNNNPYLSEKRLSYILTTARNWSGPIRDFTLTVDKGSPDALVSFCGTGVKKIAPTQFQVKATDFVPEQELDVLIITPSGQN